MKTKILDKIFIADTMGERAKAAAYVVQSRAKMVEVIPIAKERSEVDLNVFRAKIETALSNGEDVMVIFDACAGVKGDVLDTLRNTEKVHKKGTRRILLSCYGPGKIKRGFKKRGVPYKGIRQVRYRYDNNQMWMDDLDQLF